MQVLWGLPFSVSAPLLPHSPNESLSSTRSSFPHFLSHPLPRSLPPELVRCCGLIWLHRKSALIEQTPVRYDDKWVQIPVNYFRLKSKFHSVCCSARWSNLNCGLWRQIEEKQEQAFHYQEAERERERGLGMKEMSGSKSKVLTPWLKRLTHAHYISNQAIRGFLMETEHAPLS